ncbi:hypothetical protein ACFX2J_027532 [Malus domestica]
MRGGRFSRGPIFQRQGDAGRGSAHLCHRCNNRHFGECSRGSSGCFTCGQMGHRAINCPQSQQRPHNLLCHHRHRSSKFQGLVVMVIWVEVVLTIIRAMPLLMLQGNISICRILITRMGILSILKGIRGIFPFQLVDLSSIRKDSPSR